MISADTGSPHVLRFGEKGMIWLRLDATGKSAHAAHVHKGDSAIEKLLDAIQELKSVRDYPVPHPGSAGCHRAFSRRVRSNLGRWRERRASPGPPSHSARSAAAGLSNLIADHATARPISGFRSAYRWRK
jgi:succinyl-diaminopimelate desuccinylase